ncbi:unnamed protein product [Candidula unifasciata]|uniref:tRNA/rRNA methyltransferase SpoU type domain-containing protein n=1 Tax=Candidula unifasciata TaxID=100452 RepID=A0A8S3YXX8_9EUPU|nr:unnamed protein product [Candidula unifasciata]
MNQMRRIRSKTYRLLVSNDAVSIFARSYSRKTNRKMTLDPRKNVQYPYVQGDPLQEEIIKSSAKENALTKLKNRDKEIDRQKKLHIQKQSISEKASGLKFEKLNEGDIRLGKMIMKAKSNHIKTANDTILLEGHRLIRDSLMMGVKAKSIYFCDPEILRDLPVSLLKDVELFKILYKDMKVWSDAVTPAGIMGVFQKPQQGEPLCLPETTLPISLIFDGMKDPGNVGTLIRTAAAVGCQRVITTRGTVNVWDCKVLRSAMGGHFCVPIFTGIQWSDMPNLLGSEAQVFLANTRQSSVLEETFVERLRIEELDEGKYNISDSDNETDSDSDEKENERVDFADEINARQFHKVPLPVRDYSDISLSSARQSSLHVALVLGGETEGLSAQAKQFAYSNYGCYVSIPMETSVNSLNTSIAGSIILYELRKKLLADAAVKHASHKQ